MLLKLDISRQPPSAEQIRDMRREVRGIMTPGVKALMFCPIPVVDVIAGFVVGTIDEAINGDQEELWQDTPGSAARDWSGDPATEKYAAAVRAMGRELVNAEVEALEGHNRVMRMARQIGASLADGVIDGATRRASNALESVTGGPTRTDRHKAES